MLCLRKVPVAKKIMNEGGGGYQDLTSNIFLAQSASNSVG